MQVEKSCERENHALGLTFPAGQNNVDESLLVQSLWPTDEFVTFSALLGQLQ